MEENKKNKISVVALVLSIIGLVTSIIAIGIIPCFIGFILSICVLAKSKKKDRITTMAMIFSFLGFLIFFTLFSIANETVEKTYVQETNFEKNIEEKENMTISNVEEVLENETFSIEEVKETEEEYKASCNEYKYKDVLRNPSEYVGERIKITIKISNVHEESWLNECKYYFGYSESEYGWYGDRYGIFDKRYDESLKLLEDDVITVYGEISDPEYTSSLIVSSSEVFCIDMKYIDFISE